MNKIVELCATTSQEGLEQEREIDFSYFVPALAGFEPICFSSVANGVSRCVMSKPLFRALKIRLPIKFGTSPIPAWYQAGGRFDGLRQEHDTRRDDRTYQQQFQKHIITLEDPIEYVFEDNQCIEQREGAGHAVLHHAPKHATTDPDIIMIGEMRDSTALRSDAADTGHLVLSTLHTTNAAQSVNRILTFSKLTNGSKFEGNSREHCKR
jgi:twitching motility protein PilT